MRKILWEFGTSPAAQRTGGEAGKTISRWGAASQSVQDDTEADARAKSVSSFRLIAFICLSYAVQEWSWMDEHPFPKVSKPKEPRGTESHTRGVVERMNQDIFGR